jgi:hypothetical protein
MRRFLLFNVLSLFLIVSVHAQSLTIKGTVNSGQKEAVAGANVSIKSTIKAAQTAATTANGSFEFLLPKTNAVYAIRISHLGFENTDTVINVLANDTLKVITLKTIVLKSRSTMMKEVTIRQKAKVIQITGNKVLFNVSQSPVAAGKTLYDALKQVPGVFEQNNALSFQGNRLEIYIDGKQNYLSGAELKTYLQSLPASSISQIEVLPTPSSKYDARGGSVANIKSVVSTNYGTNGMILLGAGQGRYFQNNQGISLNYRSKIVNVYGSYNHLHSKKYYDNYSDRIQDSSLNIISNGEKIQVSDNHIFKAGLDVNLNKNNTFGVLVKTNLLDQNRVSANKIGLHYAHLAADSSSKVNTTGKSRYVVPSFNVFYKSVLDTSNRTLTFNMDYFRYDKSSNNNYNTDYTEGNGSPYRTSDVFRDHSPTLNNVYSFALDFTNPLKNGSFEAGLKSYFTQTDNDFVWETLNGQVWENDINRSNHFIYKELVSAAYANYNGTFKKITLTAGLRYEHTYTTGHLETTATSTKRNYGNLFPSIYLDYKLTQGQSINFSYRKSIRRFGFDVVNPFIFYRSPYEYSQGNPNILPEISHSLKLGYIYHNWLSFKANYTRANQALAPVYTKGEGNILIASQDNLSNSNTFYLSNDIYTSIHDFWDLSLSNMVGLIQFNQYENGRNILDNGSWIYQASLSNSFNLGNKWSAEIYTTYLSPFSQGIYKTRSLFQVDLGISKSLLEDRATIRLSGSDIFNTFKNQYRVNYQGINAFYREKDESRFVNLVFSYKFGNKKVKSSKTRKINADEIRNRMQ